MTVTKKRFCPSPDWKERYKILDLALHGCLQNIAYAEANGESTEAMMVTKRQMTRAKRQLMGEKEVARQHWKAIQEKNND